MTSNHNRLASLTGNRNGMDTLIASSANSLYLIFTSDHIIQRRGFAANYMAVSQGNNVENKKYRGKLSKIQ